MVGIALTVRCKPLRKCQILPDLDVIQVAAFWILLSKARSLRYRLLRQAESF